MITFANYNDPLFCKNCGKPLRVARASVDTKTYKRCCMIGDLTPMDLEFGWRNMTTARQDLLNSFFKVQADHFLAFINALAVLDPSEATHTVPEVKAA